MSEVHLT